MMSQAGHYDLLVLSFCLQQAAAIGRANTFLLSPQRVTLQLHPFPNLHDQDKPRSDGRLFEDAMPFFDEFGCGGVNGGGG